MPQANRRSLDAPRLAVIRSTESERKETCLKDFFFSDDAPQSEAETEKNKKKREEKEIFINWHLSDLSSNNNVDDSSFLISFNYLWLEQFAEDNFSPPEPAAERFSAHKFSEFLPSRTSSAFGICRPASPQSYLNSDARNSISKMPNVENLKCGSRREKKILLRIIKCCEM